MSRSAFVTIDTELNAIAAPAKTGGKNPAAARGIPNELYTSRPEQILFNIAHGSNDRAIFFLNYLVSSDLVVRNNRGINPGVISAYLS